MKGPRVPGFVKANRRVSPGGLAPVLPRLTVLTPAELIVGRVERALKCGLDLGQAPFHVGLSDAFAVTVDRPAEACLPGVRMPFGGRQRGVFGVELFDQIVNAFLIQLLFEVRLGRARRPGALSAVRRTGRCLSPRCRRR